MRSNSRLTGGLLAAVLNLAFGAADPPIVIDASEFFHEIPKGDTIEDAVSLRLPWLFNNTAISLKSDEPAIARVRIPRSGAYYLHVRSQGEAGRSFQVSIDGKTNEAQFGGASMAWKTGGRFQLKAGMAEIRLTSINPKPVLDVIVLSPGAEIDEKQLLSMQFPGDVRLLKEYRIPRPHAVKFGDLTGDGKMDFVVLTPDYSAHAFDHDGNELWRYQAPAEDVRLRAEFEAPGSIWDLDGDGRGEVIHWRMIDGREWLVAADGRSGAIKHKTEWPTTPLPHVYNNFRTAIGKLHSGRPDNVIVFTDSGGTISISAYSPELKQLWIHREFRKKDHLGHYAYPVDLNDDGIDEVVVSPMVLDASGKVVWHRYDVFDDNHDHADSFRFADIDGDGQLEMLAPFSDVGIVVFRALTGEILWQHPAEHSQQVQFGTFLNLSPRPQVAVGARVYGNRKAGEPYLSGQIHWFDPKGNLLLKWPRNPLNGNPDFVKGDWRGDGKQELFWYKFHIGSDGKGTVYLGEPAQHMFDFMNRGSEEVLTWGQDTLRVYGARHVKARGPVARSADYLRHSVANHTHY